MIAYLNTISKLMIKKIKYPKLLLLALSVYIGYLIYQDGNNFYFHATLDRLGYLGSFLAGALFAHGFTMGPAVAALLINAEHQNFVVAGLIATFGSMVGNYVVHKSLRVSFGEEIENISKYRLLQWVTAQIGKITPQFVRSYVLPVFAGIVSATPLPDEFTAALVYASRDISYGLFSAVVFFFNAFGIFFILLIGRMI